AGADRDREENQEERPPKFTARERINKEGDGEQRRCHNTSRARVQPAPQTFSRAKTEEPVRRKDQCKGSERAREVTDAATQRKMLRQEPERYQCDRIEGGCRHQRLASRRRGPHGDIVAGKSVPRLQAPLTRSRFLCDLRDSSLRPLRLKPFLH